jgi:hypothetical protein
VYYVYVSLCLNKQLGTASTDILYIYLSRHLYKFAEYSNGNTVISVCPKQVISLALVMKEDIMGDFNMRTTQVSLSHHVTYNQQ